ncbi:hypothetical protein NG798_27655, partial [Ancylothrix sp. C2]|uniref:hypothetical protein n=1 Tax=Ancylothrix sp. D3o TaxID=2953691 RepID=UPI0021BB2AEC
PLIVSRMQKALVKKTTTQKSLYKPDFVLVLLERIRADRQKRETEVNPTFLAIPTGLAISTGLIIYRSQTHIPCNTHRPCNIYRLNKIPPHPPAPQLPPAPNRATSPTPYTGPLEFQRRYNNLPMPMNRKKFLLAVE